MPVLIVSEKTWPQEGFSRKRSIRPSSSVTTIPNSSGLSTDFSPIVTAAPRSRCAREHRAQVDVAQRVARDHEDRLVEAPRREPHRAGRAERRLLDRVRDVHAERLAVAEVRADRLRQEREGDDHVLEAVFPQELDDVLHARLADDRHHRLRLVRRERAQARSLAAGHDDRLHVRTSRRAFSTYCAAATTASPSPIQKSHSGQAVPSRVTIVNASDAYSTQVASLPRKFTSKS